MNDKKGHWLNLGCGDDLKEGYVNVDRAFPPEIDGKFYTLIINLEDEWPWMDSSVDYILAKDIIEHLPDKIKTMNEIWRVLKFAGQVLIEVPTTDGPGAFQDPDHKSFWNRRSFLYYEWENPYRNRFAKSYGINACFRILSDSTIQTEDGPKLTIKLGAVK